MITLYSKTIYQQGSVWVLFKLILLFSLFPLLFVTIQTQTRGTLLSLAVALFILLWKQKKLLLIYCLILLAILLTTPIKNRLSNYDSVFHRMQLYYYTIEIIKDHPIVGIGFGISTLENHQVIIPEVYNSRLPKKIRLTESEGLTQAPHNMLLSVTLRLGVVGLLLFSYILYATAKMCWQMTRHGEDDFIQYWGICLLSAFVMFFIKGMLSPIFTHFTEVVLYTIFSMATIGWKINENKRSFAQG